MNFNKSTVIINNYEKLLQIYVSELLNLTGSLGQLSELRLLCCPGCGCVPGTAHQHFIYDVPLRLWLCFLPDTVPILLLSLLRRSSAFTAVIFFRYRNGSEMADAWELQQNHLLPPFVAVTINEDGCGQAGKFCVLMHVGIWSGWVLSSIFCIFYGVFNDCSSTGNYLINISGIHEILGKCPLKFGSLEVLQWLLK